MTLLDFIVIAVVLFIAHFVPYPLFGVPFFVVVALIAERLAKGERLK